MEAGPVRVSATYWREGRAVEVDGSRWSILPVEGVLWVEIRRGSYAHCLLGADGYWVHGDRYGVVYDRRTRDRFGGRRWLSWDWSGVQCVPVGELPPPPDAHVIRGVEVPDDVWAALRGEA